MSSPSARLRSRGPSRRQRACRRKRLTQPRRAEVGISAEAVTWGYRFFLGRDPESPEAVHAHLGAKDELQLATALMRSPEFAARRPHFDLEQRAELGELAALDIDT